tara:strand:- start:1144 stop:5190 length:4047 start_codon:yes stop_codon:yes gene_type:complete
MTTYYADDSSEVRVFSDTLHISGVANPLADKGWYWQNHLLNSGFAPTASAVGTGANSGLPSVTGLTGWAISDPSKVTHINSGSGQMQFVGGSASHATTFVPGNANVTTLASIATLRVRNNDVDHIDNYEGATVVLSFYLASGTFAVGEVVIDALWVTDGSTTALSADGGTAIRGWRPDGSGGAGYFTQNLVLPAGMSAAPARFLKITINSDAGATWQLGAIILAVPRTPTVTKVAGNDSTTTVDIKAGETVTFGTNSTYTTSFDWDFGDGNAGTTTGGTTGAPTYTYVDPGVFSVTATGYNGETSNNGWNNTPAGNSKGEDSFSVLGMVSVDDIDLIFNIYPTEKDAIANTNKYTIDNDGTIDNGTQSLFSYYIFEKLWYRIESNEPVKKFYIDWDDGIDNSPEKANYSLITLEDPQFFGVTPHTYTSHGRFYPKIRAMSTDGYWSKYYTPYLDVAQIQTITFVADTSDDYDGKYFIIYDVDNNGYAVWFDIDNSGTTAPYPTGLGLTSVEISASQTGDSAINIAGDVATALHALDAFSAVNGGTATVTITHATAGKCKDIDLATMNMAPALAGGTITFTTTTIGSTNDYDALDDRALTNNQNTSSIVSVEKSGSPRLPIFEPANKPPVGILKIDRNEIYSGIDNSGLIREGLSTGSANTMEVRAYCTNSTKNTASEIAVLVTYKTNSEADGGTSAAYGNTEPNVILKRILKVGTTTGSLGTSTTPDTCPALKDVDEILEVELLDLREGTSNSLLAADERVFLKTQNNFILCYVSLGNPIINNKKPGYSLLADGSESLTRASNVGIARYIFDSGKYFSSNGGMVSSADVAKLHPNVPSQVQYQNAGSYPALTYDSVTNTSTWTAPTLQVSDVLNVTNTAAHVDSSFNGLAQQESPTKSLIYRHSHLEGDFLDSNNRFIDTYRLIRMQVRDNSYKQRYDTAGDKIEFSYIEHWDTGKYFDSLVRPTHMKSRNLLTLHTSGLGSAPTWYANTNTDNQQANDFVLNANQWGGSTDPDDLIENWIVAVKDRPFRGLFWRLHHGAASSQAAVSAAGSASSLLPHTPTIGENVSKIRLQMWYSAPSSGNDSSGPSSAGSYVWKPLAYTDYTDFNGEDYSSLFTSGPIHWNIPEDWAKVSVSQIEWPDSDFPDTSSGTKGPTNEWKFPGYGILIGIGFQKNPNGNASHDSPHPDIHTILPFDNSHSQIIKIKDPHYVSLADIGVAQSVAWRRNGKYIELKDRMGRSDWRRISAEGGVMKFGGVDLRSDSSRLLMTNYQKDGVPVFYTMERPNDKFIRFYGVITSISEDYPTGKGHPKWSVSFNVSHIQEFDENGTKLTGIIALGGDIGNEQRYLL